MAKNWLRWAVLAVGAAVAGVWLWRAEEDPVQVLAGLGLALAVVAGALWQSRVQAVQRWRTALDVYADRALARERLRPRKPRASRVA